MKVTLSAASEQALSTSYAVRSIGLPPSTDLEYPMYVRFCDIFCSGTDPDLVVPAGTSGEDGAVAWQNISSFSWLHSGTRTHSFGYIQALDSTLYTSIRVGILQTSATTVRED
jgi:hypothetical protein